MRSLRDVHDGVRLVAGRRRHEQRGLAARAMPPPVTLSQHRTLAALTAAARGVLGVAPRQGGPVLQDRPGGAPAPARAASIPRAPPQRASQRASRSCRVLTGVDAEYVVAALVLAGNTDPGHEPGCDRHLRGEARTSVCGAWSGVDEARSYRSRRAWMAWLRWVLGWGVG